MTTFPAAEAERFVQLAEQGDTVTLFAMLHENPSLGLTHDKDGVTALMHASTLSLAAVQALAPFSNVRASANNGHTSLMIAAMQADIDILRWLLPLSDVEARDHDGRTALMLAAIWSNAQTVEVLMPHTQVHAVDHQQKTAFRLAAASKRWKCVDALSVYENMEILSEVLGKAPPGHLPRALLRWESLHLAQVAANLTNEVTLSQPRRRARL